MNLHAGASIVHVADGLLGKGKDGSLIEIVVKGRMSLVAQDEGREVQAGRDLHLLFYRGSNYTTAWMQVGDDESYQPESLPGVYEKLVHHDSAWRAAIEEALQKLQGAVAWALDAKFQQEFRREPGVREAAFLARREGDNLGLQLWIAETRVWRIASFPPDWTKVPKVEFRPIESGSRSLNVWTASGGVS